MPSVMFYTYSQMNELARHFVALAKKFLCCHRQARATGCEEVVEFLKHATVYQAQVWKTK